jgi:peptidoglycan/xylan/chitin deacetylase (PgdA/CDA1 family)
VTWSVDPQDWRQPGTDVIVERVRLGVRPGSIVVLHDGRGDRSQTVEALPKILDEINARGLEVAGLAGLADFARSADFACGADEVPR